MTEKDKKTECTVGGAKGHSEGNEIADSIISVLNTIVRGLVKLVENQDSNHGELTLIRQALEKQAEQMRRLADIVERADGHILECNEFLDQISRDINGTYSATSVCRAETIRISNGLQAALPHYLDGAKESYKDLELYKDKFTV